MLAISQEFAYIESTRLDPESRGPSVCRARTTVSRTEMACVVQTEVGKRVAELVTAEVSAVRLIQHKVVIRRGVVPKFHAEYY